MRETDLAKVRLGEETYKLLNILYESVAKKNIQPGILLGGDGR